MTDTPRPARPAFLPGLELSRAFYAEAVRPLLDEAVPGLVHSAARLGTGSDVLGFDTERSADHDWGPRLQVFLRPQDVDAHGARLSAVLSERLPKTIRGYPTHFGATEEAHVRVMRMTDGPVQHRVDIVSPGDWLTGALGFDPREPIGLAEWLTTPAQRLAEVTGGAVFHDGLGELEPARAALAWYPEDVWRYLLACQWQRIAQEEAFVGRCGEVGDELGSAVVAARLVRDLMRLCLLMDRRYPPYGKWLGSAFARTAAAPRLTADLTAVLAAAEWQAREAHLCRAYETVARAHNALGLTAPLDPAVRPFHDRPFQVLDAGRFRAALADGIVDPAVRRLPATGGVEQFVDGTDALGSDDVRSALRVLFE
ncbi:DUF4037 domain-containing protein [Streptomyces sp. TS71-3]|uniref:DUF4037 domain-containing protein n=1 Tax=Streptomyces sp. TS71-3 TaxID=2733862 RepID=UPI001B05E04C|nr:DUF4037 domain-containing protein [Streptomyces sp. TS71-3]GHJ40411.1 hypothetical protein Sm713_60200 [Streptomyces sp. TS71-3]